MPKVKFLKAATPPGYTYLKELQQDGRPVLVELMNICMPGDVAEVDKEYADVATRGGAQAVCIYVDESTPVTKTAENGALRSDSDAPKKSATAAAKSVKDNL